MLQLPVFEGSGEQKARRIVQWATAQLQRQPLTFRTLSSLGMRTPAQLLSSGKISENLGCLDRAALFGALLQKNGFTAFLVSERMYLNNKPVGIHFSVHVSDGENRFSVCPRTKRTNFVSGWVGTGPEKRSEGLLSYQIVRRLEIPPNAMNLPTLKIAGIKNRREYVRMTQNKLLPFAGFVWSKLAKPWSKKQKRKKTGERTVKRK